MLEEGSTRLLSEYLHRTIPSSWSRCTLGGLLQAASQMMMVHAKLHALNLIWECETRPHMQHARYTAGTLCVQAQVTEIQLTAKQTLELLPRELHPFMIVHDFREPLVAYSSLLQGLEAKDESTYGPGDLSS